MTLNYNPDEWQNEDVGSFDGAYEYDTDNGSFSGPEAVELFSLDFSHDPGELWEIEVSLFISSEVSDDKIVLEMFNEDDEYIELEQIDTYGPQSTTLQVTVPTYIITGDFSRPSDNSGRPTYQFQVLGSDSGNYWSRIEAVRVKPPINNESRYMGANPDSFDSGNPS